ncbi:hypothetical protein KC717_04740 [Candidatus Dojkabacteria bacterium]|uniref:tetrahydrofolate synthase n=1 Tax=Candidatus Dojkabacteria bacterium TaxID=2099670 RepID=A0A955L960_9BACT|nr:hypothetical protein [Candidatus Dojkabacteria bacterium]
MNVKNYTEALDYIFSLASPKDKKHTPGIHLDRIKKFLSLIGNPQDTYPTIHIGGTAGKGSTSYITARILSEYGLTVGIHTSPNLVALNEKFSILQKGVNTPIPCTDEEFTSLVNWFISHRDAYELDGSEPLTFYEVIIAMVFKYFQLKQVDVAIIEVALGGKLDATNVINADVASVVSVGLDHTEILGSTLEEILQDKVHIMKPGKHFISGITTPSLKKIVHAYADQINTRVSEIGRDFEYSISSDTLSGVIFSFANNEFKLTNLQLNLIGRYQAHNTSLAIQIAYSFLKNHTEFMSTHFDSAVRRALSTAQLKGRFDIISHNPTIIFDGAHNPLKMRSFIKSLKSYIKNKPTNLLFSCSQTKDLPGILEELEDLNIQKIFLTEFTKKYYTDISSYSLDVLEQETREQFDTNFQIMCFQDPKEAFRTFSNDLKNTQVGIVTGSLYLLGNLYQTYEN